MVMATPPPGSSQPRAQNSTSSQRLLWVAGVHTWLTWEAGKDMFLIIQLYIRRKGGLRVGDNTGQGFKAGLCNCAN